MAKDWGPGWRFFECENVHAWADKSRDYTSPSGDPCPACNEWGSYIGGVHRPDWPVDAHANLIEPTRNAVEPIQALVDLDKELFPNSRELNAADIAFMHKMNRLPPKGGELPDRTCVAHEISGCKLCSVIEKAQDAGEDSMNKINATISAKKSYGIYFKAFRFGEPISAEEALAAQTELGYDPNGYGFEGFSIYSDQGGTWYASWSCSSTC